MAEMLLQTIEQIGREKNIEPEVIVDAVEEAMAVAAEKYFKTEERLEAKLNRDTGDVDLFAVMTVVEEVEDPTLEISLEEALEEDPDAEIGDEIRRPRPVGELGRIAAQAAKQVIYQKVRDAERENIYQEYEDRVGELITGIVKRFERGDMIIDLGRTEAILPRREQSRAEHYNIGDRIRVVIIDVLRGTRGPQVVVSRTSPELLKRLFEMEVPEIYDGTVEIKRVVREGGDRAKMAVHSNESDVDPVGACVGMRGSRVQAIIRELRGEKIDIVQWAPELKQFAINSLKPARVNRVVVLDEESEDGRQRLEVIVDEDQLSLAIGKRGQNVRLAGKLLDCKIDIKSEEDKRQEAEEELARMMRREARLEEIPGIGPSTAETLIEAGYSSVDVIVDASPEDLTDVPGIGAKTAEKIHAGAVQLKAEIEAEEEAEAAEEEPGAEEVEAVEAEEEAGEPVGAEADADEAEEDEETEKIDEERDPVAEVDEAIARAESENGGAEDREAVDAEAADEDSAEQIDEERETEESGATREPELA